MSSFVSLPTELHREVLSLLQRDSLAALCRTCKACREYAEPFLYQSFLYFFRSEDREPPHYDPLIHPFFAAVWRRPELAAHVKRADFCVNGWLDWGTKLRDLPPPMRYEDTWLEAGWDFMKASHKFLEKDGALRESDALETNETCTVDTTSEESEASEDGDTSEDEVFQGWDEALENELSDGNVGALTAVLLSLFHNLEVLEIDFSLIWSSEALPKALRIGPHLQHLTALKVFNNLDGRILRDFNDKRLPGTALLDAPSLIEADIVLQDAPIVASPQNITCLANLARLSILNVGASPATLSDMLQHTSNLVTLEYFFAQDLEELKRDSGYWHEHLNEWEEFTAAVSNVSTTLKNLVISVDWSHVDDYPPEDMDDDWVNDIWKRRGRLGSLKELSSLERLEVPTVVLLGCDPTKAIQSLHKILPSGLHELCLRDDLIDFGDYRWTPWNSLVIGRNLRRSFRNTCDPTKLLDRLRQYMETVGSERDFYASHKFGLQRLVLKAHRDRVWPDEYLEQLRTMSEAAGVTSSVRMRLSGYLSRYSDWDDGVKEIILELDESLTEGSEEDGSEGGMSEEEESEKDGSVGDRSEKSGSEDESEEYSRYHVHYFNEPSRQFQRNT
ncbi:F-box-like domain-containing protein [Purpureocillium lavendulum]|uniref:F-box-like domain-containing protein n=1 Tax=Purpureocillium lavendulum TaxID=1247861 RepID=A0AB34FND3_9HYPO|nr:F-box-like domain-containing protein [Purpureocillium lavendulum]